MFQIMKLPVCKLYLVFLVSQASRAGRDSILTASSRMMIFLIGFYVSF